jgi:hypothetical protein
MKKFDLENRAHISKELSTGFMGVRPLSSYATLVSFQFPFELFQYRVSARFNFPFELFQYRVSASLIAAGMHLCSLDVVDLCI